MSDQKHPFETPLPPQCPYCQQGNPPRELIAGVFVHPTEQGNVICARHVPQPSCPVDGGMLEALPEGTGYRCPQCGRVFHRAPAGGLSHDPFPRTGRDTDPAAWRPPAPAFDQMTEDGVTAYAEEMAKQMCPDDLARQALITEALRNIVTGRIAGAAANPLNPETIGKLMASVSGSMIPGMNSPNRFFLTIPNRPAGVEMGAGFTQAQVWDFFTMFQTTWRIDLDRDRVTLHRTMGYTTELEPPVTQAFLEFLKPYGFIR